MTGPPRVAVLDLALVAPDSAEAWLASGLAEEVTSSLSRYAGIRVKSRGALRNRPRGVNDPMALGRELDVDYLVEGNLRRVGDRLRVGMRLTSATDGFQVWANDFDVGSSPASDLHDRIASGIAAKIGGQLQPDSMARRPLTSNAIAYEYFLRGAWLFARRTPTTIESGIAQYQRALDLDSTFVAAAARIAYGYALFVDWGWNYRNTSPATLLRDGFALADRALALDSASSEAWLARAYLLAMRDPVMMKGAFEAFEHSLALDARSVEGQYQYGQALMALGRWDEARQAYRRSLALEPERAQTWVSLSAMERQLGFLEVAGQLSDTAILMEPGSSYARSARVSRRLELGDLTGALEDAETAVRTTQGYIIPARALLARVLSQMGDTVAAAREIQVARAALPKSGPPSPTDARWLGVGLITTGRAQEALDLLERARPRSAWLWFYFRSQEFDPIRADPRFVRVMQEAHPGYPD